MNLVKQITGSTIDDIIDKIKKVIPKNKEVKTLASFLNIDLERDNMLSPLSKIIARLYMLLKYSSILGNLREDVVNVGGIATNLLLAIKGEKPRITVDADFHTPISEEKLPELIDSMNKVLLRKGFILGVPVSSRHVIFIGNVRYAGTYVKLGKKIASIIFNTFLYGQGRPLNQYIYLECEKTGIEPDIGFVKRLTSRTRRIGDIRIDGLKLSLTLETSPRKPIIITVPGIGDIRVESPQYLILHKISILKNRLKWDNASLSTRINWGVDIVKAILDLRLLRYYDVDFTLHEDEKQIIRTNITETKIYLSRITATTTFNTMIFLEEPIEDIIDEVSRNILSR